jgi:hypothetical protein
MFIKIVWFLISLLKDVKMVRNLNKKSQIGMEYTVIMGFVTLLLISIVAMAFMYSGSIKDRIKMSQISNFAEKVIVTSESIYYYGNPSKATISVYLPDGVKNITVLNSGIYMEVFTSSGINKMEFSSNVPLSGTISHTSGIKKLTIQAEVNEISISN